MNDRNIFSIKSAVNWNIVFRYGIWSTRVYKYTCIKISIFSKRFPFFYNLILEKRSLHSKRYINKISFMTKMIYEYVKVYEF